MNPAPTAEAQLQEGINLVLSRWAALRMAVENEWGGRDSLQKSQQLGHQLFYRLTQSKEQVYIDDIEDMLDEFMISLNAEIDDGSIEEIAEKLMVMHEECLEGNFDSIRRLKETNAPSVSYKRQLLLSWHGCNISRIFSPDILMTAKQPGTNDEDDSDDDEEEEDDKMGELNSSEMEIDAPQCQSNLDQKGTMTNEPNDEQAPEVVDGWTVVTSKRNRGRRN